LETTQLHSDSMFYNIGAIRPEKWTQAEIARPVITARDLSSFQRIALCLPVRCRAQMAYAQLASIKLVVKERQHRDTLLYCELQCYFQYQNTVL